MPFTARTEYDDQYFAKPRMPRPVDPLHFNPKAQPWLLVGAGGEGGRERWRTLLLVACCWLVRGLVHTVESACKRSSWGWSAAGASALGSGVAPTARRTPRHVHLGVARPARLCVVCRVVCAHGCMLQAACICAACVACVRLQSETTNQAFYKKPAVAPGTSTTGVPRDTRPAAELPAQVGGLCGGCEVGWQCACVCVCVLTAQTVIMWCQAHAVPISAANRDIRAHGCQT